MQVQINRQDNDPVFRAGDMFIGPENVLNIVIDRGVLAVDDDDFPDGLLVCVISGRTAWLEWPVEQVWRRNGLVRLVKGDTALLVQE